MENSEAVESSRSAPGKVEAILLQHPDVMAASIMSEEGPDGHSYPVAYVAPHAERMKEAKKRLFLADREKRIAQWKRAFDQVYRSGPRSEAPSFVGWTSSYTNKMLPESEMQEWLELTTQRILSLRPDKALEIGCGVGLLVEKLAPRCSVYRGADLSPVAVSRLREFVRSTPDLRHVELFEREAIDLHEQASGSVDTVIINSVVQYFPDIQYLRTVLEGAARVVKSGGRIFVGDVRHLGLLPVFCAAVQLAKAPSSATARWLKRRASLAVVQDRELVMDPRCFLELADSHSRISGVEIMLKRGRIDNELTRYRYDVVLHVGEAPREAPGQCAVWSAGKRTAAELLSRFDAERLASVIIRDVPNLRLANDLAAMRRLRSADDRMLVGELRQAAPAGVDCGLDPEDFWTLGEAANLDVRVSWSLNSAEGHFDVTLTSRDPLLALQTFPQLTNVATAKGQRPLATDPLEAAYLQQLGFELEQVLSAQLPEERRPAAVIAMRVLPTCEDAIGSHFGEENTAVSAVDR